MSKLQLGPDALLRPRHCAFCVARDYAPLQNMALGRGRKINMANLSPHWLKSWTLPQCAEFWEGTLKHNMDRSVSLSFFAPHGWECLRLRPCMVGRQQSLSPVLGHASTGTSPWACLQSSTCKCRLGTFLGSRSTGSLKRGGPTDGASPP